MEGEKFKIVFIGDSITEEGRFDDPEGIGYWYVRLIRDYLYVTDPGKSTEVINKGIGGNRIIDLAARWEKDVLALKPDLVSIFIGINDVWRQLDQPDMTQVFPDEFQCIYEDLIQQVFEKTTARIFLMEPTIHQEDVNSRGNQLLKPYVQTVRKLGKRFNIPVVPTHKAFLDVLKRGEANLTTDGVHMTSKGDMLIAKTWLETYLKRYNSTE